MYKQKTYSARREDKRPIPPFKALGLKDGDYQGLIDNGFAMQWNPVTKEVEVESLNLGRE